MKEVKSESNLVGKRITCLLCNRTFEIEAGDKVLPGFIRGNSKGIIRKSRRLILGCGHEFYLVKKMKKLKLKQKQNCNKIHLPSLVKTLKRFLDDLPLETDSFIICQKPKHLYLHFKDRDDTFSAAKAARIVIAETPKGLKYSVPTGFDSYKTLIFIPEDQGLSFLSFGTEENYKLKIKK